MTRGRLHDLAFVDARDGGILSAEVFNVTGHVWRIPTTRLSDGPIRAKARQTGLGILLAQTETGPPAYTGEAENMAARPRHAGPNQTTLDREQDVCAKPLAN